MIQNAFVPQAILSAFSATVSAYCYYNVGLICEATGAVSYKEAWVKTVGAGTAWIPSLAIILQVPSSCIRPSAGMKVFLSWHGRA